MAENENVANTQNSDLSKSNQMISDYHNKKRQGKRRTSEEILAKYFVPRNDKELFRILPPKAGKKPIEEAFFHVVTTNIAGAKKKHGTVIYCPAHNDPRVKKLDTHGNPIKDANGNSVMIPAPCPLCEKAKRKLLEQDSSVKGKRETLNDAQKIIFDKNKEIFIEANKWQAKKFYIVRGIDKGAEKDGVKFWRFKHNFRNEGTFNKLLPILEEFNTLNQVAFTDANNGTDLSISTTDTTFNNRVYKTISAISARGKAPLSSDPQLMQKWLTDDIIWRDVFQAKKAPNTTPYQFLEMIVEGNNPYWENTDANNKHWVFPNNPELEERANTRTRNNDADVEEDFEYASDVDQEYSNVPVNNPAPVTTTAAPTFTHENVNAETPKETTNVAVTDNNQSTPPTEYDDLPF